MKALDWKRKGEEMCAALDGLVATANVYGAWSVVDAAGTVLAEDIVSIHRVNAIRRKRRLDRYDPLDLAKECAAAALERLTTA